MPGLLRGTVLCNQASLCMHALGAFACASLRVWLRALTITADLVVHVLLFRQLQCMRLYTGRDPVQQQPAAHGDHLDDDGAALALHATQAPPSLGRKGATCASVA